MVHQEPEVSTREQILEQVNAELKRINRRLWLIRICAAFIGIAICVIWYLMCGAGLPFMCGCMLIVVLYFAIFTDLFGTDDGG